MANTDSRRLKLAFLYVFIFTIFIWWLKLAETLFGWDFLSLGIYPLELRGLPGILTAPLVHGSWGHVFANTLPLLMLGTALLYGYPKSRWWTILIIWIGSGIGVWLTARVSYHLGASGLTHGFMFFIFLSGILRRDRRSMALAMFAFFLYGGMVMTIFPREINISFESHLWGAIMGVVCAVAFRRRDPKPPRKVYSWELEPEDAEDPLIGDLWKKEPEPPRKSSSGDTLH